MRDSLSPVNSNLGVRFHGIVEDLDQFFHDATLFVNPILRGSGLKIKLVEALCHGLGAISTTKGAEGVIEYDAEHAVAIADSPETFISKIHECLQVSELMSQNAVTLANARFSFEAAYRSLETLIRSNTQ